VAISGLTGAGLEELWTTIEEHRATLEASGELRALRADQQRVWMWSLVSDRLERAFRAHPGVAARVASIEADVMAGRMTSTAAADALFSEWNGGAQDPA
jgi:LAO/AO transport system kinase